MNIKDNRNNTKARKLKHKVGQIYECDGVFYIVCCDKSIDKYFFINLITGEVGDDGMYDSLFDMDKDCYTDIEIDATLEIN